MQVVEQGLYFLLPPFKELFFRNLSCCEQLFQFCFFAGDSKDILYVFLTLVVGVVMGLNSYVIAFVLCIVVSVLFVVLQLNWKDDDKQVLKITIPEDMNYNKVFDDIFDKYLKKYSVKNVKTTNMGTLFMVSYNICLKKDADTKAFIDELRTRNGNLNIIIENSDDMMVPML